jgi:hypothetical protein
VSFEETIPGLFRMHAYSCTRYLGDTTIVVGPDTIILPVYDSVFSDTSLVVEKSLRGGMLDGCVLRKESGRWTLWRMAGGGQFHAPTPDDAPYIASLDLAGSQTTHTIYYRPDTTQFGIQRFYEPGELPSWPAGDSVRVEGLLTNDLDCAGYLLLAGNRYEGFSGWVPLTAAGTYRLRFAYIPVEVMYEMDGDYVAILWSVSVRVD